MKYSFGITIEKDPDVDIGKSLAHSLALVSKQKVVFRKIDERSTAVSKAAEKSRESIFLALIDLARDLQVR